MGDMDYKKNYAYFNTANHLLWNASAGLIIDQQCEEEIKDIKKKALDELELVEDQITNSIICHGYNYHEATKTITVLGKKLQSSAYHTNKRGKDGAIRSTYYDATVFLFTTDKLYSYHYLFSLTSKEKKNISTAEYPFHNIASVSLSEDTAEYSYDDLIRKGIQQFNYPVVKVTEYDGNSCIFPIRDVNDELKSSLIVINQLLQKKNSGSELGDSSDVQNSIYCSQCGKKLPADAKFCIGCGNKLK